MAKVRIAVIVPVAVSTWNLMIARSYPMANIPGELRDAAEVDGASELTVFARIVLPLSQAVTAVLLLFPTVDTASEGYAAYVRKVAETQAAGRAVVSGGQAVGGTLFWPAYKLRGMEQLFIDMHECPALAEALLARVESIVGDICVAKAAAGVEVLNPVQPEVPWDNITALVRAVREHGAYR